MLCFGINTASEAALSLSVNPLQGGNSIRFGRADKQHEINKEVRLRIVSTDGKQYQVFQRMVDPLRNERGGFMPHDAIEAYALVGSNSFGTLYLQGKETMSSGDQLIYTSSQNGDGDTLTVVYSTSRDAIDQSGNYFGKFQYTVRPIGGSTEDHAFLNVYLDASNQFMVEVNSSSGGEAVRLNSDGPQRSSYIILKFEENIGDQLKVYQEINTLPQNNLFEEVDGGLIIEQVLEKPSGSNLLKRGRHLIYESDESSGTATVNFSFNEEELVKQPSGKYTTNISFIIESGTRTIKKDVLLEADVAPFFNIDITLPPEGMKFENLLPMNPPQIKEVEVAVRSNLGKPYTVNQKITSFLTNEKGETIKKGQFLQKGEVLKGFSGQVSYPEYEPVDVEQYPIYYSDNKGSSATFKVYYRLDPYAEIMAGNYSTSIVYTLGEI